MRSWYAVIGGHAEGPFSEEEMQLQYSRGRIGIDTFIWREGLPDWSLWRDSEFAHPTPPSGQSVPPGLPPLPLAAAASRIAVPGGLDPAAYGGFWIRFLALVIDSVILFIPGKLLDLVTRPLGSPTQGWALYLLLHQFMSFLYYGLLQAQMEGSLGKRAVGLRLVSTQLRTLTLTEAVSRYVTWFAGSICLALGQISVAWNPRKQGWHDRVANSIVIEKEVLEAARAVS